MVFAFTPCKWKLNVFELRQWWRNLFVFVQDNIMYAAIDEFGMYVTLLNIYAFKFNLIIYHRSSLPFRKGMLFSLFLCVLDSASVLDSVCTSQRAQCERNLKLNANVVFQWYETYLLYLLYVRHFDELLSYNKSLIIWSKR